jgi:hypothetical protein
LLRPTDVTQTVSKSPHRSFERITQDDLIRLAQIARADFDALFQRREYSRPYAAACCVYAKALLVITSTVIAAFRTSIYGASLKRFLTTSFHLGDVGRMTLDHQSSDAIRMMAIASKAAV